MLRIATQSLEAGNYSRAFRVLQGLFVLAPDLVVIRLWLARVALDLRESQNVDEALRVDALDQLNGVDNHLCRIANLHILREDYVLATKYLLRALELFPELTLARRLLITRHLSDARGDLDEALAYWQQIREMPIPTSQKVGVLCLIANAFANAGRKDVKELYQEILELDPLNGMACGELIQIAKVTDLSDPLIVRAREMLDCPESTIKCRLGIHFALSHVYNARGDYSTSFAHQALGNQISCHLGQRVEDAAIERIAPDRCRVFSKQFIDSLRPYGCHEQAIVCIVGMPRSGTSLVHQILSQCPEAYGAGERTDFLDLTILLPAILCSKRQYPDCCSELRPEIVSKLARETHFRLARIAGNRGCVITKLPDDYRELGFISILFPNVRIIHCRRSPADTCLSCFQSNFAEVRYAHDLESLASVYRQYYRVMMHWKEVLPESCIYEVNYEELVDDPQPLVKNLCDFAGLTFNEQCLEFYKHGKSMGTASRWQVRKPIYKSSVNRSANFQEFLGPIMGLESPSVKLDRELVS